MSVVDLQELEEVKGLLLKGQQVGVLTFAEIQLAVAEIDLDESDMEELHGFFERYEIELPEDDPGPPVVRGTVTRVDPPRLIEWDTDGHGLLRWELREEGSGCVLTFTNTLPPGADFPLPQSLAGWHLHLDLLADALAGRPADWGNWPIERWAEARDGYAMQHAET